MGNNLIVVLALVIALSLGVGAWLMLSGVEEPMPAPTVGPGGSGDAPTVPLRVIPEEPPPPALPVPEKGTKDEGSEEAGNEPAPAPLNEEAAIATMKATLEGTTFTLKVDELDIRAALNLIAKLAGVEINTNLADQKSLDQKISFAFDSTPILDALQFICMMKGLKYEVGPRGIVIK